MPIYALIIFAIGALGGLILAGVYVLQDRLALWALSLLRAALGAIGLSARETKIRMPVRMQMADH